MLNRERHELVMTQILKDIYADTTISSLLGFKGGTAAYLFYGLPRFSVDLDFDLLEDTAEKRDVIFKKIQDILPKYGVIKDSERKAMTIFFLLSYEVGEYGIKIEVNTRRTGAEYEMKNYFGIPMLVSRRDSMVAAKLTALTKRKKFAARDLYDVYYFLKENWDIDTRVFEMYGEVSPAEYLERCVHFVENIPDNALLSGLGELINEKEKKFVREKIKSEVIFLLRLRVKQFGGRGRAV